MDFPSNTIHFWGVPIEKNTVRWVVPAGPMYISGRFSTCSRCCKSWYLWKTTSRHESFQLFFFLVNQRTNWAYTLWLFNIAMENSSFIDDFPIKTFIYKGFSMAMLNNQMVTDWLYPLVMTNSLLLNMDHLVR